MNKTLSCKSVALIVSAISLLVFWIFSIILNNVNVFYLCIPFTLSAYLLVFMFFSSETPSFDLNLCHTSYSRIIVIFFTIFSILCILLMPDFKGSIPDLSAVSVFNLVRYFAAILLTFFLPGYFILKTLDTENKIKFFAVIPISYIVSLFTTFLTGYILLLIFKSIPAISNLVIVFVNLCLLFVYFFKSASKREKLAVSINFVEFASLVATLSIVIVGTGFVMINTTPLRWGGDMMRHHAQALQYVQGFPVHGGMLIPQEPYLFHISLAVFFQISGLPTVLSYQLLFSLSFILVLAFYSFVNVWVKKQNTISLSMLLAPLLGFGSLYAIFLGLQNQTVALTSLLSETVSKTYDITDIMIISIGHANLVPVICVSLPVLLMFMYMLRKQVSSFCSIILFSIFVIVTYVGHVSEVVFLTILLLLYLLIMKKEKVRIISIGCVIGLLIVFVFDTFSPVRHYVFGIGGFSPYSTIVYFVSLFLFACSFGLSFLMRYLNFVLNLLSVMVKKMSKIIPFIVLYGYFLSIVVWFQLLPSYDALTYGHYANTPFFVWPIRFGVVGLFFVLTLVFYFKNLISNKNFLFLLSLASLGFFLEQITNYFVFHYWPYRFATLTFIGAVPLAAYGVFEAIRSVSHRKQQLLTAVLLITMILGVLSSSLHYINNSKASIYADDKELNALDFIASNIQSNESVLCFNSESSRRLQSLAGLNPVQDAYRWSDLLLSATNPYLITSILSNSNVKYIYVSQRDLVVMETSNLFSSFVPYFNPVIENNYITIYEVPCLTSVSSNASTVFLHLYTGFEHSITENWIDDSFAFGWNYECQKFSLERSCSRVTDGLMETSLISNNYGNTWVSYSRAGLSINTSLYSSLSFRYRVGNNLSCFGLQLSNSSNQVFFYVGCLSSESFDTRTFILPENQTITKIEILTETATNAPSGTNATTYCDYVKFFNSVSSWSEDVFLDDWELYRTRGELGASEFSSDGDILSVQITSNQSGNVWASYYCPLSLKTKNSVLSFRYKVDNFNTWFTVILHNESTKTFKYYGHLKDELFTTKSFVLPDGQNITGIEIIVETVDSAGPQTVAGVELDNIRISQNTFSDVDVLPALFTSLAHLPYTINYVDELTSNSIQQYLETYTHVILSSDPQIPLENILNWVSVGNILTIFNTCGFKGCFSDFLELDCSMSGLYARDFDSGKIIYVNFFSKIDKNEDIIRLQSKLLNELKSNQNIGECIQTANVLPAYNSSLGSIHVNGDFCCNTEVLSIDGLMTLSSSLLPNGQHKSIKVIGDVCLSIDNNSLLLSPTELFMLIKPKQNPITCEIFVSNPNGTIIIVDDFVVFDSASDYNSPFSFTVISNALSINAQNLFVNASGTVIFEVLDVHSSLYVPLEGIAKKKAEIIGTLCFETSWITESLTIFSSFHVDGIITNLDTKIQLSIPWIEVFISPHVLVFNLFFILGIVIWVINKRKIDPT